MYEMDMYWQHIQDLVNEAVQKRDRSISIFISPDNGISVTVYPWPEADALFEMYKNGQITESEMHEKLGLVGVVHPDSFMDKE